MRLTSMVLLAFLFATTFWSTPARAQEPSAELKPNASEFSVVSYNIRYASPRDGEDVWVNRKDAVANFLKTRDVFGLQEATFPQIQDLTSRLPDHDWYGLGRDDGKKAGEATPIFFRKERFAAVSKGTIWLSETPDEVGSKGWDAALPRTLTWMILQDKRSKNQIMVANTHFDHRGENARRESGKLAQQFLAPYQQKSPMVLLGDFNCLPGSEPYLAITKVDPPSPLHDARERTQSPATGPLSTWCGFKAIAPDRIIDHVFVGAKIDVLTYAVLNPKTEAGRFASDHLPIQITVRFPLESP